MLMTDTLIFSQFYHKILQVKSVKAGVKSAGTSGGNNTAVNTVTPSASGGGSAAVNDSQTGGGGVADSLQGSRQNGLPSNSPRYFCQFRFTIENPLEIPY